MLIYCRTAISALFYCTMATSTSFFKSPGNEFPIAGTSARTPCVPEINAFWVEQLRAMTNWIAVSCSSCLPVSTPLPADTEVFLLQCPGLCFLLNQCGCAGRKVQRAFEDAIQFSKHVYTVFCLLLYCAKMLGGCCSKAWSLSCFCYYRTLS